MQELDYKMKYEKLLKHHVAEMQKIQECGIPLRSTITPVESLIEAYKYVSEQLKIERGKNEY